ncbi:MAG: hypothetical protein AB1333_00615 [Patescibacteria group bacterium]
MNPVPKQILYLRILFLIFTLYWSLIAFFSLGFLIIGAADSGAPNSIFIIIFSLLFLLPIVFSLIFLFVIKIQKKWIHLTALYFFTLFELFLLPGAFSELQTNQFPEYFIGIIPLIISWQKLIAFILIGVILSLLLKKQVREYYLNKQV